MKIAEVLVLPAQNVRSSLTTPGDIRSDIAFQNDINNLLARIEEVKLPWTAASLLVSFGDGAPGRGATEASQRHTDVTRF